MLSCETVIQTSTCLCSSPSYKGHVQGILSYHLQSGLGGFQDCNCPGQVLIALVRCRIEHQKSTALYKGISFCLSCLQTYDPVLHKLLWFMSVASCSLAALTDLLTCLPSRPCAQCKLNHDKSIRGLVGMQRAAVPAYQAMP